MLFLLFFHFVFFGVKESVRCRRKPLQCDDEKRGKEMEMQVQEIEDDILREVCAHLLQDIGNFHIENVFAGPWKLSQEVWQVENSRFYVDIKHQFDVVSKRNRSSLFN